MPQTISPLMLALALGLALDGTSLCGQTQPPALTGRWHGTSICVKADWNASCNDEEAFYDFVPAPGGPPRILLHAYKRVGTAIESMGDMEFLPDTGHARWAAEFRSTRVQVRWMFQVTDSGLTGAMLLLPSKQVGRTIRAQRDSTWEPPPD
jgi:hypothetical protein